MIRWSTRLLKRLWCALLHFPYHRKYTLRERTVKICDVCDRTEDDVLVDSGPGHVPDDHRYLCNLGWLDLSGVVLPLVKFAAESFRI